jgi:hypothetical protein
MRKLYASFAFIVSLFVFSATANAVEKEPIYAKGEYGLTKDQYASFPKPIQTYEDKKEGAKMSLGEILKYRAFEQKGFNLAASVIFLCAILHTFVAGFFTKIAHKHEHRQHERNVENC